MFVLLSHCVTLSKSLFLNLHITTDRMPRVDPSSSDIWGRHDEQYQAVQNQVLDCKETASGLKAQRRRALSQGPGVAEPTTSFHFPCLCCTRFPHLLRKAHLDFPRLSVTPLVLQIIIDSQTCLLHWPDCA